MEIFLGDSKPRIYDLFKNASKSIRKKISTPMKKKPKWLKDMKICSISQVIRYMQMEKTVTPSHPYPGSKKGQDKIWKEGGKGALLILCCQTINWLSHFAERTGHPQWYWRCPRLISLKLPTGRFSWEHLSYVQGSSLLRCLS